MKIFREIKLLDGIFLLTYPLLIALSLFLVFKPAREGDTLFVEITAEGKKWIYPLNQDKELTFHGPLGGVSKIKIENGTARVSESETVNKIGVLMGPLAHPGDWSAVLPHRIFLRIIGKRKEKKKFDSLSY